MMKRTGVILIFIGLAGTAVGQTPTRTVPQTEAALEKALRGKGGDATGQFTTLRTAARRLDVETATPIVRQIEQRDLPDVARTLCRELLDQIRQERKARNQAFTQRVNAAIKKAREACRSAKSESDLNPTQRELTAFQNELKLEAPAPKIEGLATRLRWTAEAVSAWQDGIALHAKGYETEAAKRKDEAKGFVNEDDDFDGPRHVVATMNQDGSGEVTWENLPGDDEEDIDLRYRDRNGQWVKLATAPAGSTSYHIPAPDEAPPPRPIPRRPSTPSRGPAQPEPSAAPAASAANSPGDSGKKPLTD